jgi:hypothetical protein
MVLSGLLISAESTGAGTVKLIAYNPGSASMDPPSTTFDIVTVGKN